MGCWNCRGLKGSVPYIQSLPSVLVLVEHWLWPYDLDKLKTIFVMSMLAMEKLILGLQRSEQEGMVVVG